MARSTKRGGKRHGAGRPRLAEGRTRRVEITLGEPELETLDGVSPGEEPLIPQAAIRYLISMERERQEEDQ